ncbi:TrbI/VirB10 family protein [Salmonella enterica subsp. enterica serovar Kotte]|nr:TrbI/VirB10 family protein [Salmonella enterica subsp. enterica serovar Kotte]
MASKTDPQIERESFDLNGSPKKKGKKGGLFLLIVAVVVIIAGITFAIVAIRGGSGDSATDLEPQKDAALERTEKNDTTLEQLQSIEVQAERERLERERKQKEREKQEADKAAQAERAKEEKAKRFSEKTENAAMTGKGEADSATKKGKKQLTPEDRRRSGNILVQLPKNNSKEGEGATARNGGIENTDDGLSTTNYADGSVSFLSSARRKFLLKRFTKLRCTLYSEIITDHPGPIECYLAKDVYSSDGEILLARAGAQLIGERKVALAAGQASVFTNWRELELANGVRAQLNSLGTGPLGAVGTEAWIDNHYAERFGSAILLSLFDDTLATIQDMASDSDSSVTYDNSSDTASTIAETALKQSINIAPTGHVNAGTIINVLVVRDVDFAPVYQTR